MLQLATGSQKLVERPGTQRETRDRGSFAVSFLSSPLLSVATMKIFDFRRKEASPLNRSARSSRGSKNRDETGPQLLALRSLKRKREREREREPTRISAAVLFSHLYSRHIFTGRFLASPCSSCSSFVFMSREYTDEISDRCKRGKEGKKIFSRNSTLYGILYWFIIAFNVKFKFL